MASLACINGDDLNGVDGHVLRHNSFLIMSLLEETVQGEEYMCNGEQLDNIIRSFEAEINPNTETTEEHDDLSMEPDSINDLDVVWDDVELMASSPDDDLNLCIDFNGADMEMDDIVQFGGGVDRYQIYYEVPSEDHGYSSVWFETHDTAIYC